METKPINTREDLEQAAATWIARRDSGAWTEADAASFEEWLAQSTAHRAVYYRLNSAWAEAGRVRALGAAAHAGSPIPAPEYASNTLPGVPQEATSVVPADTQPSSAKLTRRFAIFAVAASVLVVLVAGTLVTFKDELFPTTHRFTTVVGGLQAIPMSDGSRVTLNTDSELRIALSARERVVEIDHGEAFFEVAHDPNRPFIVKAGDRRVTAVGTQFSVRRDGADLRVVVAEGTVRYESQDSSASSSLLPAGSVARVQGGAAVQVRQLPAVEAERNLSWRTGFLTFRNTPLAEAVAEFNRYNTRKIVIEDPKIAALEVGGMFRSGNLDRFVSLLEQGFPIQATVQADRIVLTAR